MKLVKGVAKAVAREVDGEMAKQEAAREFSK